jgi:hypothetical protein
MLWVVIDPTADGTPEIFFPTVILGFYSHVPLFLNSGGSFQVIPKPLVISCITSATKAEPIDTADPGIPNRGMISLSRHLAFSVRIGKDSSHPEEV